MKSVRRLALLFSLAALAASSAMAHERRIRAGDLPTCSETTPDSVWLLDAASATTCDGTTGEYEAHCCCSNGAWASCGGSGGGSGDVEAVWGCASGDCSDLTAASGDSLDAGSADDSSPATRSTSLPGTCTEGQLHQDTDSGGSETYVCTASNTWTKLSTTATEETDGVAPYGQYDPDNPPATCATCDEFTGDAASLTWRDGNIGTTTIDYLLDGLLIDAPPAAGENLRVQWTTGADGSATDWVAHTKLNFHPLANFNAAGIVLLVAGDETTPTDLQACVRTSVVNGTVRSTYFVRWNSYTSFNSNTGTSSDSLPFVGTVWLRLSYVSSTKVLTCSSSYNGILYEVNMTRTLGSHPTTSIGLFVNAGNGSVVPDAFFYYFRQRTDATGTTTPFPVGE